MLITKEMDWVYEWMRKNKIDGDPSNWSEKYASVGHLLAYAIEDYSKLHQPTVISSVCSKCGTKMKRSVAQWVCINQLCKGEIQTDL